MPTYEYVCEKCGQHFEKVQSISDNPLTTCPKDLCRRKSWGKGKVRRAISGGAGLLFKGSGFYITDYRSEGYKEAAKKESGGAKESGKDGGKETAAPKESGKDTTKPKEAKPSPEKKPKSK